MVKGGVSAQGVSFCRSDRKFEMKLVMADTLLSIEDQDVGIISKISHALEEVQERVRNQISAMDAKTVLVEKLQDNVTEYKVK